MSLWAVQNIKQQLKPTLLWLIASVEEVENVLLFMATMYTLYTFQQRGVQEGVTRKNQHLSTVTNKGGLKVNHMNVGELH